MKEKLKSSIKLIANILTCIIVIFVIISTIYSIYYNLKHNNNTFWNSTITDVLTIVIAIIFAYYFVERKSDKRKQKEIIEKNIQKIQKYIYDEELYSVTSKEMCNSLTRSIKIRKIKNLITYLSDYSKKFNFEKQFAEVSKNFKEYQSITEAMSQDDDFTDKSNNNVKRILETVDDNLEEILHKIYL